LQEISRLGLNQGLTVFPEGKFLETNFQFGGVFGLRLKEILLRVNF
jgi:hypothetical protein